MRRNYFWEKTPAKILEIRKEKDSFGVLRIEAVFESRGRSDVEILPSIIWVYAPSVKTSDGLRGNLAPKCFEWAYKNAKVGMNVYIHHCLDDNTRYFYEE